MANQKKETGAEIEKKLEQLADETAAVDAINAAKEELQAIEQVAEAEAVHEARKVEQLSDDLEALKHKRARLEQEIGREASTLMQQERALAELRGKAAAHQEAIEREEELRERAEAKRAEAAEWQDIYNAADEQLRQLREGVADRFGEILRRQSRAPQDSAAYEFQPVGDVDREETDQEEYEEEREISRLIREMGELVKTVNAVKSSVDGLSTQVSGQGTAISVLQTSVNTQGTAIATLNSQVSGQQNALNSVNGSLTDQQGKISSLGDQIDSLGKTVAMLLAEDKQGLEEYRVLRQQNIDIQQRRAHPLWVPAKQGVAPPPPPQIEYRTHGTVEGAGAGLKVTAYSRADKSELATTTTDADGTYEFDHLPVQDIVVAVQGRQAMVDRAEEVPIQVAKVAGR
jgi:chromosome segregation ATPase